MLVFNPDKRITVDEALKHPYLSKVRPSFPPFLPLSLPRGCSRCVKLVKLVQMTPISPTFLPPPLKPISSLPPSLPPSLTPQVRDPKLELTVARPLMDGMTNGLGLEELKGALYEETCSFVQEGREGGRR